MSIEWVVLVAVYGEEGHTLRKDQCHLVVVFGLVVIDGQVIWWAGLLGRERKLQAGHYFVSWKIGQTSH